MTPVGCILRDEILKSGPVPFQRFMELSLYHPEYGYYRKARDPFGKAGDFYTAAQLQPVFGILIREWVRRLHRESASPSDFTVVDLGAGRQEMAGAFSEFRYVPVDAGRGSLPNRIGGVVFANEFFDALPVRVAVARESGFREMLVGFEQQRFAWLEGGPVCAELQAHLRLSVPEAGQGELVEVNLEALRWLERISRSLAYGYLLVIDYGYSAAERIRFPHGTLMSYRRHQALEDVLAEPGERDITAHVDFSALERHGALCGLRRVCFESLASALLRAGEADQFAAALAGGDEATRLQRRLQLKTLLFGMGETFRVLLLKKDA